MIYRELMDRSQRECKTEEARLIFSAIDQAIQKHCPDADDDVKIFVSGGIVRVVSEGVAMTSPVPMKWIEIFLACFTEFQKIHAKENVLLN